MTDNQQRAAELWAALNIAGLDGEMPNSVVTARVASAYRAALNAAEARGGAEALRDAADAFGRSSTGPEFHDETDVWLRARADEIAAEETA